jgi:GNAT superfamily N-acetyltransferase
VKLIRTFYAHLMPRPADLTVTHHTSAEAATLMDELCEVYADAYGAVSGEDVGEKSSAFRQRATVAVKQAAYSLVAARVRAQLVGFAFGYNLRPESGWWDGLTPEPPSDFTDETGSRTVVLSEIEVRRAWQGKGIGRTVHDAFLSQRTEERAALASNPKATDTHALYERWGWHRMGVVPGNSGAYYHEYVLFVLPLPLAATGR